MLMQVILIKSISLKFCKKSIDIVDVHYCKCLMNSLQQQSSTTNINKCYKLYTRWSMYYTLHCTTGSVGVCILGGVPAPGVIR